MSDLSEFLLARIAEDEEAARDADRIYPTTWEETLARLARDEMVREGRRQHIARHDPARVLARCAADRLIVDEHRPIRCENQRHDRGDGLHCVVCSYDDIPREWHPCPTLRLLALPYADHDDYRAEWKP